MTTKDMREMHKTLQAVNKDVEDMIMVSKGAVKQIDLIAQSGVSDHAALVWAKANLHHDPHNCTELNCLKCEAIGTIINGQNDVDEAENQKNNDWAEDMLASGEVPF